MFGPKGERFDQGSDEAGKEYPRKTPYQIPGVSPIVPPDAIKKLIRSGGGSTASHLWGERRRIIDRDNRASK